MKYAVCTKSCIYNDLNERLYHDYNVLLSLYNTSGTMCIRIYSHSYTNTDIPTQSIPFELGKSSMYVIDLN